MHPVEKEEKVMVHAQTQTDLAIWQKGREEWLMCGKCLKLFKKNQSYSHYIHLKTCKK